VVDFIGRDAMQNAKAVQRENINYMNLREDQSENVGFLGKFKRILKTVTEKTVAVYKKVF
jgi:hypothetical protein